MRAHRARFIVVSAAALVLMMSPAYAADSGERPPVVKGTIYHRGTSHSILPHVKGLVAARPQTLPFTGADLTLFVVVGVFAVGVGAVLLRRAERP
jgi:membrane-bound metal-dependent hydrolase YbcI (DUF457 family)